MLSEIDCCCSDKRVCCSRDELIDIMCDPGTDTHYNARCWDALKSFKFKAKSVHDLCNCHDDKELFEEVKSGYMDCIRDCRDESFIELDQLELETKNNGGTADDLKDIDTIKQMFRDIPQETSLDSVNTVLELIEIWPSLLLPSTISTELSTVLQNGDVQRSLYEKNKCDDSEMDETSDGDIDSLIDKIDNLDDLRYIYNSIKSGDCLILEEMTEAQLNDVEIWKNYVVVCQDDVNSIVAKIEELEKTNS
jgi:ASC-1-like (ASCH) protein